MIPRMGTLKNIKVIFLASLFLMGCFFYLLSTSASSDGISIWPPSVTVDMKDVFPEEEIKFKIQVNNLYSHDINVSTKIENQISYRLKEGYTDIPNLSWIKITPNILNLSAEQSKFLEVTIDVPDEEKSLHYNERWEVCIVVSEIKEEHTTISTEYAIGIYIKTPEIEKAQNFDTLLLLLIGFGFIALVVYILYLIKRKKIFPSKKPNFFYFKKRTEK